MARERGLDLVEVAPNAIPPVCRLMDYGKFRYEQSRKDRESRRNQHVVDLKEIRIQPKIGDHDLETKGRQAAKFLDGGDKVKFTVRFRGREMAHPEIGRGLLDQLVEMLRTTSTVEQAPRLEGRTMTVYLAPVKPKLAPSERVPAEPAAATVADRATISGTLPSVDAEDSAGNSAEAAALAEPEVEDSDDVDDEDTDDDDDADTGEIDTDGADDTAVTAPATTPDPEGAQSGDPSTETTPIEPVAVRN